MCCVSESEPAKLRNTVIQRPIGHASWHIQVDFLGGSMEVICHCLLPACFLDFPVQLLAS